MKMLSPIKAEPAHVALDGVDIFLRFLGRVGVVVAQAAMAAEFLRHTEIQTDRFGVADVQIAIRFRREASDNRPHPACGQIGADNIADEILTRRSCRRFRNRHECSLPSRAA